MGYVGCSFLFLTTFGHFFCLLFAHFLLSFLSVNWRYIFLDTASLTLLFFPQRFFFRKHFKTKKHFKRPHWQLTIEVFSFQRNYPLILIFKKKKYLIPKGKGGRKKPNRHEIHSHMTLYKTQFVMDSFNMTSKMTFWQQNVFLN